jgi:hypothetical protein
MGWLKIDETDAQKPDHRDESVPPFSFNKDRGCFPARPLALAPP